MKVINKFALFVLTALICVFAATVSAKPPSQDPPTQPDIYTMLSELGDKLDFLQSDVDDLSTDQGTLQGSIDDVETAIDDVLAALAKPEVTTVEIFLPTGNFTEILPVDFGSGKVYSGRITGFLSLTAVSGATVDLFCQLWPSGTPSYSLAGLAHGGTPEYMSVQVNQQFTCAGLEVRHINDGTGHGPRANLTVEWEILDITDEVINSGI